MVGKENLADGIRVDRAIVPSDFVHDPAQRLENNNGRNHLQNNSG